MAMTAGRTAVDSRIGLPPPVTGASAWYGPDVSASEDWIYTLTATEIGEVETAVRPLVTAGVEIARITRADFPLPMLSKRLAAIGNDLIEGRGFCLLRGLPVERWSIREAATAYFGIGTYLGSARSQNADGHVLGHVRDLGRDAVQDPTARVYQTRERQTFHTDSCDVVGLLCLRTARSGGESALVSSMTIYNEMYKRRPDLLARLFEPFATDRRGEVPAGCKPYFRIPVYNFHQGYLSAIYARRYIDSASRFDEVPELTGQQRAALDMFDALANDPDIHLTMAFRPGDIQFVHNHTILHDRTAFEDWAEPDRRRHLLRLWLAIPGARPLPAVYAERYGQVTIGDRGGIIVPGARLHAPLEAV